VFEDGLLDIMLEYKPMNTNNDNAQFMFLIAEASSDATFLKAQVYTPSCLDCSLKREGVCSRPHRHSSAHAGSIISMAGATLAYQSTDSNGAPIYGIHTQNAQTGTRALCLPFTLFGLGRSPNFVQSLKVGLPSVVNAAEGTVPMNDTNTWEQIVPNSRMYIVPPTKDGNGWIGRLYLTPSRLVLLSVATMTALLAIVLTIILGLWWRERQLDNNERKQQSQRFDFNAM
jgi:integrin alpha FG-GAP repeat containing protein 1